MKSKLLVLLPVGLLAIWFSPSSPATNFTAEDLLVRLRAKDASLQNVVVEYELTRKVEEVTVESDEPQVILLTVEIDDGVPTEGIPADLDLIKLIRKYGDASVPLDSVPQGDRKWVQLIREHKIRLAMPELPTGKPSLRTDALTVRMAIFGHDVASHQRRVRDGKEILSKWVSQGQVVQKLALSGSQTEWLLRQFTSTSSVNSYQAEAIWLNLALGAGYGERISGVRDVVQIDGGYRVRSGFTIWPGQMCDAVLEIDEHGLVRRAEIECEYITTTITNEGHFRAEGIEVAERGTLRAVYKESGALVRDLTFVPTRIEREITRDRFLAMADMAPPDDRPLSVFDSDSPDRRWYRVAPAGSAYAQPFFFAVGLLLLAVTGFWLWMTPS